MSKIISLNTYYYKKSQIDELLNNKSNIDHTHSQYLTQHQDISGKVNKTGHAPNKNLATNNDGVLITEDKPTIPTKTSDLTNDSGFVTIDNIPELNVSELNISNKADKTGWIPNKNIITDSDGELITEDKVTKTSQLQNDNGFITINDIPESSNFSGSYNDLTNKPTIPTKTSELTNDSGYITINSVPTKTSQLNNDNGFITINDLPEENNNIGTFTDLQNAINQEGVTKLILDKDYKYDSTTDSSLTNGITISKNITIIGNGHIIDGNNTKRAFYCNGNYTLELNDLKIQNCTGSSGGAISAMNNSQININNTNINNNTSSNGGAIHAIWNSQVNITNTTIQNNNSNNYGGAIYVWSDSQLTMKESIIKNNTATNNYANIYCSTATTVYNCEINDISTTCYNVTNKDYLTDHQSLSNYVQKNNSTGLLKNDGTVDTVTKQETLVSGTNIKTINNESILGSGNITISGGASGTPVQFQITYSDDTTETFNVLTE